MWVSREDMLTNVSFSERVARDHRKHGGVLGSRPQHAASPVTSAQACGTYCRLFVSGSRTSVSSAQGVFPRTAQSLFEAYRSETAKSCPKPLTLLLGYGLYTSFLPRSPVESDPPIT